MTTFSICSPRQMARMGLPLASAAFASRLSLRSRTAATRAGSAAVRSTPSSAPALASLVPPAGRTALCPPQSARRSTVTSAAHAAQHMNAAATMA